MSIIPIEKFPVRFSDGWIAADHIGRWATNSYMVVKSSEIDQDTMTKLRQFQVFKFNMGSDPDKKMDEIASNAGFCPDIAVSVAGVAKFGKGAVQAVLVYGEDFVTVGGDVFRVFYEICKGCEFWIARNRQSVAALRNGVPIGWVMISKPGHDITDQIRTALGW